LFVGLATLFAELLRPLAPSRAAIVDAQPNEPAAIPPGTGVPDARETLRRQARPPIAQVPPAVSDALDADMAGAPATPLPDGPLVAIMITELGPNAVAARSAIERLPAGVSLAFSPYADAARGLAVEAANDGHEVWLSVPMQPKRYPSVSPGKNVLLTSESGAENVRRLEWALSRVDAPIGITNMMGSAFTEDVAAMRPVLAAAKARNLAYVDARSSGRSVGEREARAAGMASTTNDRFLDEPATPANIRRNLDDLVATAKRRGHAIGYARALPETIGEIERWAGELDSRGVTLVGASYVARRNSNG
jgi:hypothetical protein